MSDRRWTRFRMNYSDFREATFLALPGAMTRPLRLHIPGMLYHVFSRGNDKAPIFRGAVDYRLFLELMEAALTRFEAECLAYCLMGNHDHILIRVQEETVSRVMQQLNSSYCQQFNRCHGHVGPVLQGRFGCKIVEDGEYARTVIRYIALNPVAGFCARPEDWQWSSYRFALGLAPVPAFLALHRVWEAFGTTDPSIGRERLRHFVAAGVEDTFLNPLMHGSATLTARVAPLLEPLAFHREFVRGQRHAARPSLGELLEGRFSRRDIEDAVLIAFDRHAYTLAEIGATVGRAPSTIWRWIQRAKSRQDQPLRRDVFLRSPRRRTFAEKSRPDPL